MNETIQTNYIFINPKNKFQDIYKNRVFCNVQNFHENHYRHIQDVRLKYWSYAEISELVHFFDIELFELFKNINLNYAALISDIGRLVVLYYFGGVYHDLKCISNTEFVKMLKSVKGVVSVLAEQHPKQPQRVRIGNIVALCPKDPFFKNVLIECTSRLNLAWKNKAKGKEEMFKIGSGSYIDIFEKQSLIREDVVKKLLEPDFISFDKKIYKMNIRHWQNVNESIFKE